MSRERERRGWLATVLAALGATALVFALVPPTWPNPLPQGPVQQAQALPRLRAAAAAVDAACSRGDLAAFASATTASHRSELLRRLQAFDRRLDAATLRALSADASLLPWLERPLLAGEVRGDRIALVFARPDGFGAQLLTFAWDGRRLCFDGGRQLVGTIDPAEAVLAAIAR